MADNKPIEYLIETMAFELPARTDQMNARGAEGWELVTIFGAPNNPVAYYMRRS